MGDMDFFTKGMEVEVCSDDVGLRGAWFRATVLRSNLKKKTICVEYKTLVASEKDKRPLREFVNMVNLRPIPPREMKRNFESSDEVDAYHNDGWWEGVIIKVLDNSRYSVYFRPGKEEIEFEESQLRIHREWVNGFWVPPMKDGEEEMHQSQEQRQQEEEGEKIKNNQMGDLDFFTKGMEVEVCSDDVGFRGAWFTATVLRSNLQQKKICVEYKTLIASEKDTRPLKEFVNMANLRPIPPREIKRSFESSDEVDAYHNDGWWEGVVIKVLDNSRYSVYFRSGKEEIEFEESQLRIHREWVNGFWVPPMKEEEVTVEKKEELPQSQQQQEKKKKMKKQKNSIALEINQTKTSSKLEVEFHEGMQVEVSSDEEGFVGAWYTATVVKVIGKNRFLVEYQTLRTEDESELLIEEVDDLHIRPSPPDFLQVDSFSRLEEVDAMYNDGWWVGVISKVLGNSRYYVYFRENNEEIEFGTSQLRLHQDWIDGKWLRPSEALLREVKEV